VGFLIAALLVSNAFASGGRSLPTGAQDPAYVDKMYSTPRGEVHFVSMRAGNSALLRNNKGAIAGLKETRGPAFCEEWLASTKAEALPRGCDFIFHDEVTGGLYSVRSEEMEEGTLFHSLRSTMRGALVAL